MMEGNTPHFPDTAEITYNLWNIFWKETIGRCWMKAEVLPLGIQAGLQDELGKFLELNPKL